ncbi:MAG: CHASE domain-containing protein [Burkholderiales bacterium]|nr:CHASE domain-containing protein [Burkholderiales bacterium]
MTQEAHDVASDMVLKPLSRPWGQLVTIVALAIVYYLAARLGLLLAFAQTNASPVWPPSGLALAVLLMFGRRAWPGVMLGAFAANFAVFAANHVAAGTSVALVSLCIAIGNALEALLGQWALAHWLKVDMQLSSPVDVVRFLLVALLCCLVSALGGTSSLLMGGIIPSAAQYAVFSTWWLGDVTGMMIVTPLLLAWVQKPEVIWPGRAMGELCIAAAMLALVVWLVFSGAALSGASSRLLVLLLMPCIVWCAYRYGQRHASLSVFIICTAAVLGTTHGSGPFATGTLNESLLTLQSFIGLCSVSSLLLVSDIAHRVKAGYLRFDTLSLREIAPHWSAILLGLCVTTVAWHFIATATERRAHERFDALVSDVVQRINNRLMDYAQALRSGQALLAVKPSIEATDWRKFVATLRIEQTFPGIQGLGYATYFSHAQQEKLEAAMRRQGVADYHVWPANDHASHVAVTYIEPLSIRNARAIGYDLSSDATRDEALIRARDSGRIALSGNVTLVQEANGEKRSGFLIFLPIYRDLLQPVTVTGRRQALSGYVYGAFRVSDFMLDLLGDAGPNIATAIYDGPRPIPEAQMYVSPGASMGRDAAYPNALRTTRQIQFGDHTWSLDVVTLPGFETGIDRQKAVMTLLGGTLISLLAFLVSRSLIVSREEMQAQAATIAQAFAESEIRFGTLLDAASEFAIIATDWSGTIKVFNIGAQRMLGYTAEEMVEEQTIATIHLPAECEARGRELSLQLGHDVHGMAALFSQAGRGIPETLEWTYVRKDGSTLPVQVTITAIRGSSSNTIGYLCIASDLTQQKKDQHIQSRLLDILSNSPDFVGVADMEGRLLFHNTAARRMVGLSDDVDLSTLHIKDMHPEWAGRLVIEEGLPTVLREGVWRAENAVLHRDGHEVPVSQVLMLHRDANGEPEQLSTIMRDITAQKVREKELADAREQAEAASRAKSAFVANMSHEIRTPMNAVLGMAQLLDATPLTPEQRRYLGMIRSSGQSLLGILNNILDFSKVEAGRLDLAPTVFQLNDVLNTLATVMTVNAGEKDLELVIGVEPDVPMCLYGDALRLQQILVNLVGNAIKFTERGEVAVLVECIARTGDSVRLGFRVRDTGIGMNADEQAKLFTAFTQADASITRRFGGTGLGLAISRQLAELMGGTLTAHSEPDRGSEFCLSLPLTAEAPEMEALRSQQALAGLRLLVVDDNATSRDYLSKTISGWGWHTDSVDSGVGACDLIRAELAAGRTYDVVLVDWQMPRTDGLSTMRSIRSLLHEAGRTDSEMPVGIMVSAFGHPKLIQGREGAAADVVLIKPITPSNLFDALHEVLVQKKPLGAIDAQSVATFSALQERPLAGAHLLLVEDNALNQVVAKGLLTSAGASLEIAENGAKAVECLRQNPERFHLVLMDVQMPVMDGITATHVIRTELRLELPILAMSAGVLATEREECLAAKMDDFIAKPIEREQMLATIVRHLPGPAGAIEHTSSAAGSERAALAAPSTGYIDVRRLVALGAESRAMYDAICEALHLEIELGSKPIDEGALAWDEGRYNDAARVFHTIRGSVGTFATEAFVNQLSQLEHAIVNGEKVQVDTLLPIVRRNWAILLDEIQAWLAVQSSQAQDLVLPVPAAAFGGSELTRLGELLQQQNMAASSLFNALRNELRQLLDSPTFAKLEHAIAEMDFQTAANIVRAATNGGQAYDHVQ